MMKIVLFLTAFAIGIEGYVPLSRHSLLPPFTQYKEHNGQRLIPHWEYGGAVIAKENFLRLTPDRQSKRGWLLNTERMDNKEFGMQLRFRISGGGKNLYGDGVGLWLTKKGRNPRYEEGQLLGHTDSFVGIGILFDTFRNVEAGHVHKDVSLIVGTSEEDSVDLGKERPGCEAHYRYHEGREDFDVSRESKVRVWLENNRITVEVDAYGKDDFKKCFEANLNDYNLPGDWQDSVHFSLSASTGALADNHDILELKIAEPHHFKHILQVDSEEKDAPAVQIDLHKNIKADEVGEHLNDLAYEVSDITKSLAKLQHKVEHDIENVKMHLERMIKKLEDKEKGSEDRIDGLEAQAKLEQKLEERVKQIERDLGVSINSRMNAVNSKVEDKVLNLQAEGGSWKLPLFFIVVLVGAYMAYTARSLNKLHRRDKLI